MDYPPKKVHVIGMMQGIPGFVASFFLVSFLAVRLAAPECLCTVSLCGIASVGS